MSECIVSGTQWGAQNPIREDDLAARIDALPASAGLWRFIALLSLGGFFELYDLFQTGYISAGLIADGAISCERLTEREISNLSQCCQRQ